MLPLFMHSVHIRLTSLGILVDEEIPMTAGCMKPLHIIIPEGTMLSPSYPAAVVAGNVETSSVIVDAILIALKQMAGSQGTSTNVKDLQLSEQFYFR